MSVNFLHCCATFSFMRSSETKIYVSEVYYALFGALRAINVKQAYRKHLFKVKKTVGSECQREPDFANQFSWQL